MTPVSDIAAGAPEAEFAFLSHAAVLRLQTALVVGVSLAAMIAAVASFRPVVADADSARTIAALVAPVKIRPGADLKAVDDAEASQISAETEAPVELPPIAPTRLATRTVKTIRIAPDGSMMEASRSPNLEAQATQTRQALGGDRTPGSTQVSDLPGQTPRVVAAALVAPDVVPLALASRALAPRALAPIVPPGPPATIAETAPAPVIQIAPAPQAPPSATTIVARTIATTIPTTIPTTAALPAAPAQEALQSGGYFVQLAASSSEDEAQRLAQKLRLELGDNLGHRDLIVRTGSVRDKAVYRVRVGELSREEANAMCQRIKGRNACFVAKD